MSKDPGKKLQSFSCIESFGSKSTEYLMFVHAYQNHGIKKHQITSDCYSACTANTGTIHVNSVWAIEMLSLACN